MTYPSSFGTAIFASTVPVSVSAAFTTPSVPDEYNTAPSGLNARHLQLPLCRFVRHAVSIVPHPFSEAAAPSSSTSPSALSEPPLVVGGRR